ncbi:hypothetical protein [Erythrobacter sp.]|uniref:hypothetical protein n=1 Tax=Erythrobacter sp. TaxID=1042 RepID=UPI0025D5D591|nr:hypothetical protein [Erythrobacter sp.]
MHHHGSGHPPILSSLIIIRTRPEYESRSLISSLALFTVIRTGRREATFDLIHARFDPTDTRAAIIEGLVERIPPGAQLLVRQPVLPANKLLETVARHDIMPPLDNTILAKRLPGVTLLPVTLTDEQLTTAGKALELEMPDPNAAPIMRNRRAPEAAMTLWSIYTTAFCRSPEARSLIAAFQAWRVLEQARPLRF